MIELIFEFILVGLVGGLLGLFYRNCLKPQGMIFNFIYYGWLKPWAECTEDIIEAGFTPKAWDKVKAWVAKPLGYCIYCNTTIITIILCILYLSSWEVLPAWQNIIIGVIAAIGVQHLVVLDVSKYLMYKHPDFDNEI